MRPNWFKLVNKCLKVKFIFILRVGQLSNCLEQPKWIVLQARKTWHFIQSLQETCFWKFAMRFCLQASMFAYTRNKVTVKEFVSFVYFYTWELLWFCQQKTYMKTLNIWLTKLSYCINGWLDCKNVSQLHHQREKGLFACKMLARLRLLRMLLESLYTQLQFGHLKVMSCPAATPQAKMLKPNKPLTGSLFHHKKWRLSLPCFLFQMICLLFLITSNSFLQSLKQLFFTFLWSVTH